MWFFWLFLLRKIVDIEKHNLLEIFSLFMFLVYHQHGKRMFLLKIKHTLGIFVTLPVASFKWPTDARGFSRKYIFLTQYFHNKFYEFRPINNNLLFKICCKNILNITFFISKLIEKCEEQNLCTILIVLVDMTSCDWNRLLFAINIIFINRNNILLTRVNKIMNYLYFLSISKEMLKFESLPNLRCLKNQVF